jgi:hemerythrin-like metal-binding protein
MKAYELRRRNDMAFFDWKEEYSGGIDDVDKQHKVIIELMNGLFDAIRYEKGESTTKKVFVELLKYANYHFHLESELFKRYQYVQIDEHIHQHQHFIDKIKNLMISDYLTDRNIPLETLHYLKSWFQDHMLKIDLEYCRFFQSKELMNEIDEYLKSNS